MIEIRIHGRGGQGGVTLAKIIATSRFLQGQSVQAFGLYAAERSGAPLQAFCRYSDEPIANRNLIYQPDHVIVLDPTLIGPAVSDGLKPGGWILLNTSDPPEAFADRFPTQRLATVDATRIARDKGLGTRSLPIVNTALAGAVGKMLDFQLEEMNAALEHLQFLGGNLAAANQAWASVELLDRDVAIESHESAATTTAKPPAESFVEHAGGEMPKIHTGQWATQQPFRQQAIAPCNHVCPAGNDVRGFLQALAREEVDEALEVLLRTSPFPAICGRVCPAPCEANCNRIELDGAVNVRELERYAGDHGTVELTTTNGRPQRIAIIGSGPAGLTAAYHLARHGYGVTVLEAGSQLGGLLRTGIPGYRLPEEVLDRELERIFSVGVEVETDVLVDKTRLFDLARSHSAVLVATGLQELRSLPLGTGGEPGVEQGIEFLERSRTEEVRLTGEEVVVVGGGNTALDAARTALRLGAESVRIIYRRTLLEMPAIREEIDQALDEGIDLLQLLLPVSLSPIGEDDGGRAHYALTCREMELGEPDASGRRRPLEIEGSDFDLSCHRLILALGQAPDLSVFPEGTEVREGHRLIGLLENPIFAVGDLATGDGTVAGAIGSGRRAALHIHETLSGELIDERIDRKTSDRVDVWSEEVVRPESMRLHLFERQAAVKGEDLMPWQRTWNFEEVHAGLPDLEEAKRCLSCGGCNECDRCVTYCPEGVLKRVGSVFEFDYSYCKGCGVCAAECPRNVIFMSHL